MHEMPQRCHQVDCLIGPERIKTGTSRGFIKHQNKNSTFAVSITHTITTPYMDIGHILVRYI